MQKSLPKDITSYDLLKTAAVLFMFADHIGFYFYPHLVWLRIIGRFSAPVWFFLIGYAETRHVQAGFWIGGVLIAVSRIISGVFFFPLNALFAMAACRLLIDRVMAQALKNYDAFIGVFLLLFFLGLPSQLLFEYGTLGIMFVMVGYMMRHRPILNIKPRAVLAFVTATGLSYIIVQLLLLPALTILQLVTFYGGMIVLCAAFFLFAPASYPRLTRFSGPLAPIIRLTGRRTLEIYVIHLLLFAALAMWVNPARFHLFNFQWFPPGLLAFFLPPGH